MRRFRAASSSLSPSWKSTARLTLPSRLELKMREGSAREAPLAKVISTTLLYVSPVQIIPLCDQTGVPLHFHSSATSGTASLIRARIRESISPLQSPRPSILASISSDGDSALFDQLFFMLPASPLNAPVSQQLVIGYRTEACCHPGPEHTLPAHPMFDFHLPKRLICGAGGHSGRHRRNP